MRKSILPGGKGSGFSHLLEYFEALKKLKTNKVKKDKNRSVSAKRA
jgi:hypothetical protein